MKHNFKNLEIWKRSMTLAKEVYLLSSKFPKEEKYGLTSQIRRSAVSVPSNIAEGCGRKSPKELVQFISIANGSLCELETQLILAKELSLLENKPIPDLSNEITEIRKMIYGFTNQLS